MATSSNGPAAVRGPTSGYRCRREEVHLSRWRRICHLANDGIYAKPTLITKITTPTARWVRAEPERRERITDDGARVSFVLNQVVQRGKGRAAASGERQCREAGTSQMWAERVVRRIVPQLATVTVGGNPIPVRASREGRDGRAMIPSNGFPVKVTGSRTRRDLAWRDGASVEDMPVEEFLAARRTLRSAEKLKKFRRRGEGSGNSKRLGSTQPHPPVTRLRAHRGAPRVPARREWGRGIELERREARGRNTRWRSRAVF